MFANPHQLNHSGVRIFSEQNIHHTYCSNIYIYIFFPSLQDAERAKTSKTGTSLSTELRKATTD